MKNRIIYQGVSVAEDNRIPIRSEEPYNLVNENDPSVIGASLNEDNSMAAYSNDI